MGLGSFQACGRATTVRVSNDKYMFDAHDIDRIREHRESAVIVEVKLIGNITVHEDVARFRISHDGLWDARVCAADPEDLWGLSLGTLTKEIWVSIVDPFSPLSVGG